MIVNVKSLVSHWNPSVNINVVDLYNSGGLLATTNWRLQKHPIWWRMASLSGNMKMQKMALARPKEVGALRHVVLHTSVYVFRFVVQCVIVYYNFCSTTVAVKLFQWNCCSEIVAVKWFQFNWSMKACIVCSAYICTVVIWSKYCDDTVKIANSWCLSLQTCSDAATKGRS